MDAKPVPVLTIDGDSASRNYLLLVLRKNGDDVQAVPLGREGLITAWKDQPRVILFGPALPDLGGKLTVANHHHEPCLSTRPADAQPPLMSAIMIPSF